MDSTTISALSELSGNGFWAVFFYALLTSLPDLVFTCGLVAGVRALYKKAIEIKGSEE